MNNKIIIGSRGSQLSVAYSERVKNLIIKNSNIKSKDIEIRKILTKGDIVRNKAISSVGGKNVFCKEIENQLIKKKIDIAVHSLKDMDSVEDKHLIIQAYLKRNDPRDALILKKKKNILKEKKLEIGTSSKRRSYQLRKINKKIQTKFIRGNIDTRVNKILFGKFDGAIFALAGLKVLKLNKYVKKIFPTSMMLPSAGQGIVAVQCKKKNHKLRNLIRKINNKNSEICALAERSFLRTIEGDCQTAAGCFAKLKNRKIYLSSELFSDDGKLSFKVRKFGKISEPIKLGRSVGEEMLRKFLKLKK